METLQEPKPPHVLQPTPRWPDVIGDEAELDEVMTRPSLKLVQMMKRLKGDIAILGIGGKMGITLGGLAARACREAGVQKKILGVSRFSDSQNREAVEKMGVQSIRCDLLDPNEVRKLPKVENVIFMAGRKFGTVSEEAATWASNTIIPANVAQHFTKSRIVVFSTGCVYPLVHITSGGCKETDPANPVGEYAQSCLGRERIFEYYSRKNKTASLIYRLNYAIDLRYGVLQEVAQRVWTNKPIHLTMGYVNVIWQGDANSKAFLCLDHCSVPPAIMNVTGSKILSIRGLALQFGELMNRRVTFVGKESPTALLNNAAKSEQELEKSRVTLDQMLRWTAHWITHGGSSLNKPTHFEVRDGQF